MSSGGGRRSGGMSPSGAALSAAGRGRSGGWCGWVRTGEGRVQVDPTGKRSGRGGVYLSGGGGGV